MKTFVKGRLSRVLARVVMVAFVLPLVGSTLGATAAYAQQPQAASVIVFTLENKTPVGGDELAERVTNALQMALADSGRADVVSVGLSSPTVQRAINVEKTLTEDDFALPMDKDRAARIAQGLGVQFALMGAIEAYRFDEEAGQVSITLSVQKIEAASGDATAIGVVGSSSDHKEYNGKEGPLMTEAIDDAVYRVVEAAFGPFKPGAPKPAVPTVTKPKKKNKVLLPLLIVLGALLLAGKSKGARAAPARAASPVTNAIGQPTGSSVELSWDVAAGKTVGGFNIYRAQAAQAAAAPAARHGLFSRPTRARQAAGSFEKITNLAASARSYSDTTATAGQLYVYRIVAVVSGSEANPATCVNYYNSVTNNIGPGVPQPPTGITATMGVGVLAIMVQWAANQEPFIIAYRVYRAQSGEGPFDQIAQVGSGVTQYNDTAGLVAGTTYYYKVGAVGAVEAQSAVVSAAAQAGQVAPPTNLVGWPEQGQVRLTWDAPADPSLAGFNIYRNGAMLDPVTGVATTTYTDTTVVAGETYSYFVRSRAGDGSESENSNTVTVGPSAPPDNIELTAQPDTIVANGASTSTLSALVTAASDPVGGADVHFTTDHGTLVLDGQDQGDHALATTNTLGIAQCQLRSVQSTVTVVANVTAMTPREGGGEYSDQATVTMEPATPATIEVSLAHPNLPGDGESSTTVTATVKDQTGTGVPNVNVTFSIMPELGALDPLTSVTNANGQAQTTLTSTGGWGSAIITATTDGIQGQATVNFTPPPTVTVSVNPDQLPAGGVGNIALVTATVKYLTGEPAADGTLIRFAFEPDSATTSATGARISAGEQQATTASGLAYSHVISAPNLDNGDSDFVMAWIERTGNEVWDAGTTETKGTARITYTEAPFQVTVTADPESIPADGDTTSKISADVRTAIPNPIGPGLKPVADGSPVRLTTTIGTFIETGSDEFNTTTLGGLALGYLQAPDLPYLPAPQIAQVTATSASVSGSAEVEIRPVTAYHMEIYASPASIAADGASTSTIKVRVVDSDALPQEGVSLTFTADLGSISPSSGTTDSNGEAETSLRAGYEAGTASVICRALALDIMATKLVTITGGEPAYISSTLVVPQITLPATNGLPSPCGASPQGTVYARVTDKYGNAVLDGTQVQFTTDIGQITASAPTSNGMANGTLISCNFEDATNRATYRPGVSSTMISCDTHGGKITNGPWHVVFSGDFAIFTLAGGATTSNLINTGGGDFRTGAIGGAGTMPSLSPVTGHGIGVEVLTYDANNNPLPAGVPISFAAYFGCTLIASGTGTTSMTNDIMSAGWGFTPGAFPGSPPKCLCTIKASVPAVVNTRWSLDVLTWVGADKPAGAIEVASPCGNNWQANALNMASCAVTGEMHDGFNNAVQDGNGVVWTAKDVRNLTYQLLPTTSNTSWGTATTVLTVTLIDPENAGSVTIVARAAADPNVTGSYSIAVNPYLVP